MAFNVIFPHGIVNHLSFSAFGHSRNFRSQCKPQLETMWAWWVYSAWNKEAFVLYALGNLKHNAPILLCHETFSQHSPWFMTTEPAIRPEAFKQTFEIGSTWMCTNPVECYSALLQCRGAKLNLEVAATACGFSQLCFHSPSFVEECEI